MKKRVVILVLVGVAVVLLLLVYFLSGTTLALAYRDLEMAFVVTDADTGVPIPNALILLVDETQDPDHMVARPVTDGAGKVRLVRPDNQCTHDMRPLRARITHIAIPWDQVRVSAPGYRPTPWTDHHAAGYHDQGWDPAARLHRVQFRVQLHKQNGEPAAPGA